MTNKERLLDLYADGEWRCSTAIAFMRDFRKRISELREDGYVWDSIRCDGRCDIKHTSTIHMYRLVDKPRVTVKKQVVEQLPSGGVRISYV